MELRHLGQESGGIGRRLIVHGILNAWFRPKAVVRVITTGAFNIVPDSILRQIVTTFTAAAMPG